jgi:hypothetical protein
MFAAPQIASERYVQRAAPLKGSAKHVAEAVAGRLFAQGILEALLARWTRFNLLEETTAIRYMSAFSKQLIKAPIHFSVTTTSFSLFDDPKWAINLNVVDPFDKSLMARLLQRSNDLFDRVTRHGASRFKFNDLLERRLKRKDLVKLFLKHVLKQFPQQRSSVLDVVECVLRELNSI